MSSWKNQDFGYKAAISDYDCEEHEEIFHFWSTSKKIVFKHYVGSFEVFTVYSFCNCILFLKILDDKNIRRRFRASNYQSTTRVKPFICTMPMRLDEGWNQIQFNLADFTRRAYGTGYVETLRVQLHANCRVRRVYFSDRLYSEDELPAEFKLFLPVQSKVS